MDNMLKDALLGGPGLDGYAYQADVYCEGCAGAIIHKVYQERGPALDDLDFRDSEILPQPIFFGESDSAEHCAKCGGYLYGPEDPPLDDTYDSAMEEG